MFNAIQFFKDYNIPYTSQGKNSQKGWININCPFHNDSTNHLGFNLKKNYFNCWHCGWFSIIDIIKNLIPNENPFQIKKRYERKIIIQEKLKEYYYKPTSIEVPGTPLKKMHKRYLKSRNFDPKYLEQKYDLRGTGYLCDYRFRIIAPIYYKEKIVSYQGRDITDRSKQRYKACSKNQEIIHHKYILYNINNCKEKKIIVTEGITDVWRLGDNSCCTFGKNYSIQQLNLLRKYKEIFIFFDPDEAGQKAAKKLGCELYMLGCKVINIKYKTDPADMIEKEVIDLKSKLNFF